MTPATVTEDPRRGLTSASSAEADFLCPGRWYAQRGLPDEAGEYAAAGTRVHAAMEGQSVRLSDDEAETVERAKEIEFRMVQEWLGTDADTIPAPIRERRIWTHDADLQPLHSGQIDAYWIDADNRGLIEEIKSLFGDIEESARNLQLRDQAALLWEREGVSEVTVFVNQPRVTGKPVPVTYTQEDLALAHREMLARVYRSQSPGQPRKPGEKQCAYCRAKLVCPEATATVTALAPIETRGEIELPDLLRLLEVAGAATKVIESVKCRAKGLIERAIDQIGLGMPSATLEEKLAELARLGIDPVPGWTLEAGDQKRKVTKTSAAFQAIVGLLPLDLQAEMRAAFLDRCVTVKVSEFETAYRKISGMKSLPAKEQFNAALESVEALDRSQNKPSLARAKAALPAA